MSKTRLGLTTVPTTLLHTSSVQQLNSAHLTKDKRRYYTNHMIENPIVQYNNYSIRDNNEDKGKKNNVRLKNCSLIFYNRCPGQKSTNLSTKKKILFRREEILL